MPSGLVPKSVLPFGAIQIALSETVEAKSPIGAFSRNSISKGEIAFELTRSICETRGCPSALFLGFAM